MSEKEAAARLFLLSKAKNKDLIFTLLRFLRMTKNLNLSQIEDYYLKICKGSLKVLEILSNKELTIKDKTVIKRKFNKRNTILVFSISEEVASGVIIKDQDRILNLSIQGLL